MSVIVKRFKDEDYPKIFVSVNMLDTGFDCPELVPVPKGVHARA